MNTVQLALGTSGDTVNVNSTAGSAGSVTTTIFGNGGGDAFTINGDALQDHNVFRGDAGNDLFTLNIAANIGAAGAGVSSLTIEGNSPSADSVNRDRLTINDNSGAARQLNYQYLATPGDLNIDGAANLGVAVQAPRWKRSCSTPPVPRMTSLKSPAPPRTTS